MRYRLYCQPGAFEGNASSFDFNWLRLNEVICWYCVTCLESPLCNSCVRCALDFSLCRRLDHLLAPLCSSGWWVPGDRHGPAGGGMKGLVAGLWGSGCMCQLPIYICSVVKESDCPSLIPGCVTHTLMADAEQKRGFSYQTRWAIWQCAVF